MYGVGIIKNSYRKLENFQMERAMYRWYDGYT